MSPDPEDILLTHCAFLSIPILRIPRKSQDPQDILVRHCVPEDPDVPQINFELNI